MSKFYRRIQRRMHMQYHRQLKVLSGKECKITCNMENQEWQIKVGSELIEYTLNDIVNKNKGVTCVVFMGGDSDKKSLKS